MRKGIIHALRRGSRWADRTDVYAPKKTLCNHFVRWGKRSIWDGIFSVLASTHGTPDKLLIAVVASRLTAAQAAEKGGSWLIVSTAPKVTATSSFMLSATRYSPHVLTLTLNNVHDCKVAQACIEALLHLARLIVDEAYVRD